MQIRFLKDCLSFEFMHESSLLFLFFLAFFIKHFSLRISIKIYRMDKATVLKVARLARIKVNEDKIDHYAKELTNIMDVIEELKSADTKGLEPLVNVSEFELSTREDEVTDGNCSEKVLKNAPKQKFEYFTVPKVIE